MRSPSAALFLFLAVSSLPPQPAVAQQLDAAIRARIDSIFMHYDRTNSPGCALLVRRDGQTVYARGYGMASIELGVAITPQTVMDIGSTSKQFTAAAIWLLAQQGKLRIDDEIQRYIPELPRVAAPITLRHLLQHTSGLRDYLDLLVLGGVQDEEVTTAADALTALQRQHGGNFLPGAMWSYCNSGFFLLGQVVERVSGTSMRIFLHDHFFAPLGMTHTDILDDHQRMLPGKASSYGPGTDGWKVMTANWEQTGDGAVQTSVEDLAKWDANFDSPLVCGRALIDSLQRPGRLNDGTPLTYAYGLEVDTYRGLHRVHHGGSWAGFRAMLMRFPDQRLSICLTANAANADVQTLAERISDILLSSGMRPTDAERLRDSLRLPGAEAMASLKGIWWNSTQGFCFRITVADTGAFVTSATGGAPRRLMQGRLMQAPDGRFVSTPVRSVSARLRFDRASGHLLIDGPTDPSISFVKVPEAGSLSAKRLREYAGDYTSPEIPGLWRVEARGDSLWVQQPRHPAVKLDPLFSDGFLADDLPIQFIRDDRTRVSGLKVVTRGVHNVVWTRSQ